MYIQRMPPNNNWTKMDNDVIKDIAISDGAFRLYSYLIMVPPSVNYDDTHLMEELNLSRSALSRRKLELKKADLLCIEQIGPRIYHAYMGHSRMGASMVRAQMKKQDLIGDSDE